jgi:hypothetical protein
LFKKGKTDRGALGFQRRYFILDGDNLHYFRERNDSNPTGTISLKGTSIKQAPKSGMKHSFEIYTPARTYYLFAETSGLLKLNFSYPFCTAEMHEWFEALNKTISGFIQVDFLSTDIDEKRNRNVNTTL